MENSEKTSKDLPDQGDRTPRSRRGGSSVPATPASSSYDGRLEECTAGSSNYTASAKTNPVGVRKRGRCNPRVVLRRVDSSESITSTGSMVSTESLEAQLPEGEAEMSFSSGEENTDHPPSDEAGLTAWAAARAARPDGRGRPPTHGQYIGLGKAREALRNANLARKRAAAEAAGAPSKRLSGSESGRGSDTESIRRLRRSCLTVGGSDVEVECETRSTLDLVQMIHKFLVVSDEVAGRAKNLKGTDVKALREAGRDGRMVADKLYVRLRDNLAARTAPVLPQIYKENEELRLEVRLLREEVAALQARVTMPPPPPPAAAPVGAADDLLTKIGALIDAKLAAVRPPPSAPTAGWQNKSASRAPKKGKIRMRPGSGPRNVGRAGETVAPPPSASAPRAHREPVDPGPSTSKAADSWSKVVGRKAKKKAGGPSGAHPPAAQPAPGAVPSRGPPRKTTKRRRRARLRAPTTAAVVVVRDPSAKVDMAEAMKRCRLAIPLESLGIRDVGFRRTMTGDLMLEIPGPDMAAKADALAVRMEGVLAGTGVGIRRPSRPGNLRVRGIDGTVSREEVVEALAREGNCSGGEIRLGELRTLPSGLKTVWAQCPMLAAKRLAAAQKVAIGWSRARVEALKARPLRCFRCLRAGHVGQYCPSTEVDRSGRCFRCGLAGHVLRQCTAPEPRCPVCSDLGRKARHVLGGPQCDPPPARVGGIATTFAGPACLAPGVAGRDKRRPAGTPPPHEGGAVPGTAEERMEVEPSIGGTPSSPILTSVVAGGVSTPSVSGGHVPSGNKESTPVPAVTSQSDQTVAPSTGPSVTKAQARLAALLGTAEPKPKKAKPGPRCSKS